MVLVAGSLVVPLLADSLVRGIGIPGVGGGVAAKRNGKGSQSWSAGQAPVTRSRRAVPDIAP